MGEAGEGAEVFKNLFGGFSGSLSLFTNNPFQRGNTVDAAGAPALSQPQSNEKGSSKESVKKSRKPAWKEQESKKAEAEPIIHSAEKKKNKKKKNENVVGNDTGAPDTNDRSQDVASQGTKERAKAGKKRGLVADETGVSNRIVEDAPSNAEPTKSVKELSSAKKEKEKRSKRKVVEEEIREEFEKKFKKSDGKKAISEAQVQGVHSEDPEIDSILHESIQKENKVCSDSCSCALSFQRCRVLVLSFSPVGSACITISVQSKFSAYFLHCPFSSSIK